MVKGCRGRGSFGLFLGLIFGNFFPILLNISCCILFSSFKSNLAMEII